MPLFKLTVNDFICLVLSASSGKTRTSRPFFTRFRSLSIHNHSNGTTSSPIHAKLLIEADFFSSPTPLSMNHPNPTISISSRSNSYPYQKHGQCCSTSCHHNETVSLPIPCVPRASFYSTWEVVSANRVADDAPRSVVPVRAVPFVTVKNSSVMVV